MFFQINNFIIYSWPDFVRHSVEVAANYGFIAIYLATTNNIILSHTNTLISRKIYYLLTESWGFGVLGFWGFGLGIRD